jgi:hypothetical protein
MGGTIMGSALKALATLPLRLLLILLYLVSFRWLMDLIALVQRMLAVKRRGKHLEDDRRGRPLHCAPRCAVIPPSVYKRADPLIYSQGYLMEQGLAVTWDNPDIQLFKGGVPVSSSSLAPDTDYVIDATIYNNSTDAPAVGLPVDFTFMSFGVGAAQHAIGMQHVVLPIKGAPGHPAHAKQTWHTPAVPGHYCVTVRLIWPDDANPKNNLGQENTNVVAATSPAVFKFPVRNEDTIPKAVRMEGDAYQIPRRRDCDRKPDPKQSDRRHPEHRARGAFIPPSEEAADWTLARVRHDVASFPIPAGWTMDIEPSRFQLAAGAARDVTVTITPPNDFHGERSFNVNALHGADLLGGVTLRVTKA